MNVSRIIKNGDTILLGAMTLSSFILFAKVDMEGRAETLLKQQTPIIKTEQLETAQPKTSPDSLEVKKLEVKEPKESKVAKTKPKPKTKATNETEVTWLAKNIYHESRGQNIKGQYAVAIVTMNRVHSGKFADSVEQVVKQPGQFSWYRNHKNHKITDKESYEIAKEVAQNVLEQNGSLYEEVHHKLKGAMYFHEVSVRHPEKRRIVTRIGKHIFFI